MGNRSGIYGWKLNGYYVYVGKSVDVESRMKRKHEDSDALNRAVQKYGFNKFEKVIICYCEPDELNELEEHYIRKLGTHRSVHGFNLTFGGDGQNSGEAHPLYGVTGEDHPSYGQKRTDETRRKMSLAHRGIRHTENTKRKIAESKTGENNPFFGVKWKSNTTSKYFGVSKRGNSYRALVTINGHILSIGTYRNEIEAANAYNNYVVEHGLPNPLNDI